MFFGNPDVSLLNKNNTCHKKYSASLGSIYNMLPFVCALCVRHVLVALERNV